jgi:hypothetical protein
VPLRPARKSVEAHRASREVFKIFITRAWHLVCSGFHNRFYIEGEDMQKFLALIALSLVLVGCNEQKKQAQSLELALQASTGHSYTIVKLQTEKGNFSVFRDENTGEYIAYNMDKWDRNTMTSYSQYAAVDGDIVHSLNQGKEWVVSGYWQPIYNTYTDYHDVYSSSCNCYVSESYTTQVYVGDTYVDTSHWYTFYTGGGFRFENNSGVSKDLETIAALKDDAAQSMMKAKFKSEFSLSDNRAGELAKLANKYTKVESARELTSTEKDQFALSALGVNMNQVESAMKKKAQGQDNAYNDLLKQAAQVNNTTPEQIGKFFDQMSEASL